MSEIRSFRSQERRTVWGMRVAWAGAIAVGGAFLGTGIYSVYESTRQPESQWPKTPGVEQLVSPSPSVLPSSYEPAPLITIHVPR